MLAVHLGKQVFEFLTPSTAFQSDINGVIQALPY
jgi:hypothetical protein